MIELSEQQRVEATRSPAYADLLEVHLADKKRIGELEQRLAELSWVDKVRGTWIEGPLRSQLDDLRSRIAKVRDAERLAELFHATYERLAPDFGYRTREASAKPWADVPETNRALMVATCREAILAVLDGEGEEPAEHIELSRDEWKDEWKAAAKTELAQMATDKHFTSTAARKLWALIGGTLDEEKTDADLA